MNNPRTVLHAPVVTEKATNLRDRNTYTFKVDRRANKIQIRNAVESIFDVRVQSVRVVNVRRKPKRQGMFPGSTSAWKKAYITLRAGDAIEILEAV
jgi:large subunit ribosomal protein L23